MLEIIMVNAIRLPIEYSQLDCFNINFLESEGVATNNQVLKFAFNENTLLPIIELVILNQFKKQQNNRFYNFN